MNPEGTKYPETILTRPVSSSRRFLNFLIDLTFWGIIILLLISIVDLNLLKNSTGLNVSLLSSSFLFYYFAMEISFQRTLGKFVTNTRVVNELGRKPTPTQIFIRTLCRLIPFDQISFLVVRKGFHDYLSNTMVTGCHKKY